MDERKIDWEDIRVLVALGQFGSTRRAAAALGVTQPTIWRRLARLESSLAVSLVTRPRSGLALTEEGRRAVKLGREMERTARRLARAFAAAREA